LGILSRCVPMLLALAACDAAERKLPFEVAPGVRQVGRLSDRRITESSGVVASRTHTNLFWTHNDGGGPAKQLLFAIHRAGDTLAAFPVQGAEFVDWEDIGIDESGRLYLADIGNNNATRHDIAVYQVDEPDPKAGGRPVPIKRQWRLQYPDRPFDAESLFVWNGRGYIVSKVVNDAHAQIFGFPLADSKAPLRLELVATTKVDSPVSGADLSPDGRLLALVAKNGAYLFRIDGDVSRATKGKSPTTRFRHESIEGCCFVPEGLLDTSEKREVFLFTDPAFRWK
ncbi:MAG: hypothetical protein ACREUU_14005, partial [Gammaproteobacteria bacterium]